MDYIENNQKISIDEKRATMQKYFAGMTSEEAIKKLQDIKESADARLICNGGY